MGSSAHDSVGDAVINRRTSSPLHGRSVDSSTSAVNIGPYNVYSKCMISVINCGEKHTVGKCL